MVEQNESGGGQGQTSTARRDGYSVATLDRRRPASLCNRLHECVHTDPLSLRVASAPLLFPLHSPFLQTKWTSLEHNGILFPAAYIPHNKPMLYEGAEVVLTPEQEEVASMWALMPESYQQQPTFAKNFFRDFKALFPKDSHIKELAKVWMTEQTCGSDCLLPNERSASACASRPEPYPLPTCAFAVLCFLFICC